MLILSRKIGEVIVIGGSIKIKVLRIDRDNVRIGVDAPKDVPVHREEVQEKIGKGEKQ